MNEIIHVLDKGYVRLLGAHGRDLDPVNAARVSYNKEVTEFGPKDKSLLDFLGREDHTSPFRHSFMKFEIYAPLMVARQWWKYIVGSDHGEQPERDTDPFTAWNESSRRYITEDVEFYIPQANEWRKAPLNSKQGSGGPLPRSLGALYTKELENFITQGEALYEQAIKDGVATEMARLFLPAYGLYVRWRWAASLQGVCHFLYQRLEHDAQYEIQQYANAVDEFARKHFPNAVSAYVDQKLNNKHLLETLRQHGIKSIEDLEPALRVVALFGDVNVEE